ncbi:MAG: hypothetical protein JST26_14780 [Bacteroidetes bacterium]|nr:hypothetical protein [Bacteroidota bacterium]
MKPTYIRLILFSVTLIMLKEVGGHYVTTIEHPSNIWWFNVFMPVEYILPACVYCYYFMNRWSWLYFTVSTMGILWLSLHFYSGTTFNFYTALASSMCLVPLALFYFMSLFRNPEMPNVFREPLFWISTGLLIYHVCHLAAFWAFNMFTAGNATLARKFGVIVMVLAIINYIFILISFLCRSPRKMPS